MNEAVATLVEHLRYLERSGVEAVRVDSADLDVLLAEAQGPKSVDAVERESVSPQQSVRVKRVPNLIELPKEEPAAAVSAAADSRVKESIPEPEAFELPEGSKKERWEWLRERVLGCEECNKHVKPGKQVVFGVGSLDAKIFFCGEAPGADEETEGEPFVGKAGQLLTKIIGAMGLKREDVYIGNIMNWRPEMPTAYGNRPPTESEMRFCLPYLKAQVEIVQPDVIVALGSTAVSGLLGADSKRRMGDVRGTWHSFEDKPLMITFHPSYLLRNNTNKTKRMVWEDMMLVMESVGMPISDKQRGFFL